MMIRDKIAFWRQLHDYAGAMEIYLDMPPQPNIKIDLERLITETESEVWTMVDRYRESD